MQRMLMREQAELDEGAGVEEQLDALARGQLVARVLLGDRLLPAHGMRAIAALREACGEVVEGWLAGHQRPRKFGARFSRKAVTPSRKSSVMDTTVSCACRYRSALS